MLYVLVSTPANLASIKDVQANVTLLKDPATSFAAAGELALNTPAFLHVHANVHGDERSGCEASLRIMYELADRTDCAAEQILSNAVTVI